MSENFQLPDCQDLGSRIKFEVIERQSHIGKYQFVIISLLQNPSLIKTEGTCKLDEYINPQELKTLQFPPELDGSKGIVFYGWAPTWLYAHLVSHYQTAPWVACWNIRQKNQAVVVASQLDAIAPGDEIPIPIQPKQGLAIIIGGPPDSGKSAFSYALQRSLRQYLYHHPVQTVFLHRANWDGEGNWAHEVAAETRESLIKIHEKRIHELPDRTAALAAVEKFFNNHAQTVQNIRHLVDVVLVDIGGAIQPEKNALLAACTHYIVVSKDPKEVTPWQQFFENSGLQPIAIVHSKQTQGYQVLADNDFLEIEAGCWERGKPELLPNMQRLLEATVTKLSL